jgi:hypothetical protein
MRIGSSASRVARNTSKPLLSPASFRTHFSRVQPCTTNAEAVNNGPRADARYPQPPIFDGTCRETLPSFQPPRPTLVSLERAQHLSLRPDRPCVWSKHHMAARAVALHTGPASNVKSRPTRRQRPARLRNQQHRQHHPGIRLSQSVLTEQLTSLAPGNSRHRERPAGSFTLVY